MTCLDQHRAGIGHARHARVGHISDVGARFQRVDHLFGARALVVQMQTFGGFADLKMFQKQPRMPRVFTIDHVDRAERFDRAGAQIA